MGRFILKKLLILIGVLFLPIIIFGCVTLLIAIFGALFGIGLWRDMPMKQRLGGVAFNFLFICWPLSGVAGLWGLSQVITREDELVNSASRRRKLCVCLSLIAGIVGACFLIASSLQGRTLDYVLTGANSVVLLLVLPIAIGGFYILKLLPSLLRK